ncbi:hypothetical protein AZF37_04100 [endosymbiont 'TC1' of Trimyema compressum]|uniref:hypothetical protein n=1 Tax=endosymbiont 'TC1' of Trimyema compressum TaxID=243899 RepID=UPI0007F11D5B|nr:hypothetical protein [endosymbiont 'TC1' of Trimyema compressum]AMP20461.1 hypothetical protein AZF37_04100 [endosymbiont 'TC1' of Trimyema compressum]
MIFCKINSGEYIHQFQELTETNSYLIIVNKEESQSVLEKLNIQITADNSFKDSSEDIIFESKKY